MVFINFIHILFGGLFFGLVATTFFLIVCNIVGTYKPEIMRHALKISFIADGIIFLIIFLQMATAGALQKHANLKLAVPWVTVAYIAFSLVCILWILSFTIKFINFKQLNRGLINFKYKLPYLIINSIMIVIFMMIIHDAILQSTYFTFLF